ncbi:MAG: histidinol-phosphate transaminase [Deltaproteobacteria bacterium]|nr:histidinol-phosphate transaminase [Deltaproteobacteria bacterium]
MRPLVEPHLLNLPAYVAGKPIEETEREYGVTNIAKLASNENCLGPSPKATAAVRAALDKGHLYPDAGGFALKARLARLHDVDAAQIVLGNGTNEVITLLCRALLGKNDALLNAWPSFVVYRLGARAHGVIERVVPLKDLGYDLEALADVAASDRSVKLVFLANPNNPTGMCFGRADLDAFLLKVPSDVVVVLDEAYAEYVRRPDYEDAIAILKRRPRTMMLRTFSKVYGLAAYRVGYGVGDPELVRLLESLRDPFNVSALGQVAALAALDDVEHVTRSRDHNAVELPRLTRALEERGLKVAPSEANFVLARIPESLAMSAAMLNIELLKRALIVRPVANYDLPMSLRVTVGTVAENDRLLDALDVVLAMQMSVKKSVK